jgi:hypothetical protein
LVVIPAKGVIHRYLGMTIYKGTPACGGAPPQPYVIVISSWIAEHAGAADT